MEIMLSINDILLDDDQQLDVTKDTEFIFSLDELIDVDDTEFMLFVNDLLLDDQQLDVTNDPEFIFSPDELIDDQEIINIFMVCYDEWVSNPTDD